jgi:YggT family protein
VTGLVCTLLGLYLLVLLVRIVLSWIPISPGGAMESIANVFYLLTEPVLGPLRRVLPPVRLGAMALDLSPLVVFIGIQVLRGILC